MSFRPIYVLALASLALVFLPALRAGVVFSTGFEAPTYTTGKLAGQNGWFGSTVGVVESGVAYTGTQAVEFNSAGTSGQNLTYLGPPLVPDAGDLEVTLQVAAMFSSSGTSTNWDVLTVYNSSADFMDQLLVNGGDDATLGLASTAVGSVVITKGVWNVFDLELNYSTQTASAYVNGTFIGSGAFATASNGLGYAGFGINSAPGTQLGYFDDLLIETPEPGSAALLLAPIIFGAFLLRKRASRVLTTH
jgi:hypothetical protein